MEILGIFPTRVEQDINLNLFSEQPLGLAYILAAAQKTDYDVKLYYGNLNLEDMVNCDVLALSLLTKDVSARLDIARRYKEINPNCKVIVGSYHVTGDPNLVLEVISLKIYHKKLFSNAFFYIINIKSSFINNIRI